MTSIPLAEPQWRQRPLYSSVELTDRYDAIADRWHHLIGRLGYLRAYRTLFATLSRQTMLPNGGRVVDCGVGSGGFTLALLQATPGPWHVEGIDLSARMLQVAARALRVAETVTLHQGDACHLPQADNVADLVMSAHMLEHLPNPVAALQEMMRVLKPGGLLITVITRQGLLGSYIRRKWGVVCVQEAEACRWLWQTGFVEVHCLPMGNRLSPCTWSSLVCVGQKP